MGADGERLIEQIDAMAGVDAAGRLTGRDVDLYVFRTPEQVICRCHARLAGDVARALAAAALAPRGRPRDWPMEYGRYLSILASVGRVTAMRAGPLYCLLAPPRGGRAATRITAANARLLSGGLDEWLPDVASGRPMCAALVDGRAVSVCASVKAVEGAHAAGVETLPAYRGRGLASESVAAWARVVLEEGATPFYATSFDNVASLGVARRLGMQLLGSEFSLKCELAEEG
jgi:GNAT superfamily N-acetyltransferase